MAPAASDGDAEIWVPVTINLPLGFAKSWTPDSCIPSNLLCGPFAIIFLAQTANTVLVPVLPFLVKDVGASAAAYGALQSALWISQTVLAPLLGMASDRFGRRQVILLSLLFSAAGNMILALSSSVAAMFAARIISGLGFQISLFRAYFADVAPTGKRSAKFGLIGVVQGFSLFGGPAVGGFISQVWGRREAVWLSVALFLIAVFVCACWRPDGSLILPRKNMEDTVTATMSQEQTARYEETHKTVAGVKLVKLNLNSRPEGSLSYPTSPRGIEGLGSPSSLREPACCDNRLWRFCTLSWKLAMWVAQYDLYPLLTLNFFFRFAFAAYKSVFAFFCASAFGYEAREVGLLLSGMGIGGMFVQGGLVRIVVSRLGEGRTLLLAMLSTSAGFVLLSTARGLAVLVPALALIAIGYGLTVPCLSALFAAVPVEQGVMQGFAGAIDRFGQAFGPIMGGMLLEVLGEAELMAITGCALATVSSICLLFIGQGLASWLGQLCERSDGYEHVASADVDEAQDDGDAEILPLLQGELNGAAKDELSAPQNNEQARAINLNLNGQQ